MNEITIRFFATLKDLAGTSKFTLPFDVPMTIDSLREKLAVDMPALAPALPSAIAAVNEEYVFAGHEIKAGDTVAFFPPVSGGSGDPENQNSEPQRHRASQRKENNGLKPHCLNLQVQTAGFSPLSPKKKRKR